MRLKLYKGAVSVLGRRSPNSLLSELLGGVQAAVEPDDNLPVGLVVAGTPDAYDVLLRTRATLYGVLESAVCIMLHFHQHGDADGFTLQECIEQGLDLRDDAPYGPCAKRPWVNDIYAARERICTPA